MAFKARKIPKHLIIREEYQLRRRSRPGLLLKLLFGCVALLGLTYVMMLASF